LLAILIDYIIPLVYNSFMTLITVLAILFVFRIKDSGIRILFFFLPLIKPFLVVAEKIEPHPGFSADQPINSGIRIPDPSNLLTRFNRFEGGIDIFVTDINYLYIIIISLSIVLILVVRWFNLYLLYRNLACEDKVTRKEIPLVYRIIDSFSRKLSIRPPDVSLTHRPYYSPFVVGIRDCTIVIYPNILEVLEREEKEVLLHHELSHIKRKDNLIGWIAMVIRDFMFFNPFAYMAYYLIRAEQDSGSDKLMVSHSPRPARELAKNILNAVKKLGELGDPMPLPGAVSGFVNTAGCFFAHFRLRNRVISIIRNGDRRIRMRVFPRIMMYILFALILVIQVMVVIDAGGFYIYLR
jgi:beta-lactamase regulating signal transducer with metallopeptidase domain